MNSHIQAALRQLASSQAITERRVHDIQVRQQVADQRALTTTPNPLPVFDGKFSLVETPDDGKQRVRCVTKNGVVYTAWSHYIRKTEDWGETWSDHLTDENDLPKTVRHIGWFDTGELLVAGTGGEIYKSDESEGNWRKVFDYPADGGPYDDFGFQIYGDLVLTASYGDQMDEVGVYLSKDRGETWETILMLPGDGGSGEDPIKHIHDVKFDPYEGLIWVVCGDDNLEADTRKNRIYVSPNWGHTWQVWRGYRLTQIMPLPNCVIFSSDLRRRISVVRYDRPLAGTASITNMPPIRDNWPTTDEWPFVEAWFMGMIPDEPQAYHWGTNAAVTYGANARAVFGFRQGADSPFPLKIWTTDDGMRFNCVWMSPWLGGDVGGVFGPDQDGNYVAAVYDGEKHYLLRLAL